MRAGTALTPPDNPNEGVTSNFGDDNCGRSGSTLEVWLVRADGSDALRLFHADADKEGISVPNTYRFDGTESHLYHLKGAATLEAFDLPQ